MVETRGKLHHSAGGLKRDRVALIEAVCKVQLRRLFLNRLDDPWVIVARITAPKIAGTVDNPVTLNGVIVNASADPIIRGLSLTQRDAVNGIQKLSRSFGISFIRKTPVSQFAHAPVSARARHGCLHTCLRFPNWPRDA